MSGTTGTDWIWMAAGAGLGVIALVMLAWSLFWDRPRGRKRCPKCWYDMQGAEADEAGALRCPECGTVIARERRLRKTRRRWRWAVLSIVLLVTGAGGMWPQLRNGGWTRLIPNAALVRIVPTDDVPWQTLVDSRVSRGAQPAELRVRLVDERSQRDQFSAAHWATFWRRMHGRPYNAGEDARIRAPRILLARDRWPRGMPMFVVLDMDNLVRLRGTLVRGPVATTAAGRTMILPSPVTWLNHGFRARLSGVEDGWMLNVDAGGKIAAELEVDRVADADGRLHFIVESLLDGTPEYSFRTHDITLVNSAADCMTAVRDASLTETLARNFELNIGPATKVPYHLWVARGLTAAPAALTLGLTIEVRYHGTIVAAGHKLYPASEAGRLHPYAQGSIIELHWDLDALRPACDDPAPIWTMHVRGDANVAIDDLGSNTYWAGEFEAPFDARFIEVWCEEEAKRRQAEAAPDS